MKLIHLFGVLLAASTLQAQTFNQATATAKPPPVNYVVSQQTGDSRVWQKVVPTKDAKGNTVLQTNEAFVELSTGLNFWRDGRWNASSEAIDISPDGSSAWATNGEHQAYFPGNIYNGQIKLVTPDGKVLQSQPIGLSFSDGSGNSVLIAVLTNSTGAILPSGNQVIYTNAFDGLKADLVYSYTKAGIEQDIVVQQQPPDPVSLGLNPKTTRLQVLTEFFNPPQPSVTATAVPTAAGNLEDDYLGFGVMGMGRGKAFLVGNKSPSVRVNKRWLVIQGRQFLVEEVPIVSVAKAIDTLPPFAALTGTKPVVSRKLILPQPRLTHATPKTTFLARATPPDRGLVLDYQILSSSQTNYVFCGDTTYYISGWVNLRGTTTFEGGTVLKYSESSGGLNVYGPFICLTAPYRPAVFTSMNDNSVGSAITGSSGSPGYVNNSFIGNSVYSTNYMYPTNAFYKHMRFSYGGWSDYTNNQTGTGAIYDEFFTAEDVQFVNCLYAIDCAAGSAGANGTDVMLKNVLFANCGLCIGPDSSGFQGPCTVRGTQVTVNNCLEFANTAGGYDYLTNSIFANTVVYVPAMSGDHNGFYKSAEFGTSPVTNYVNPFQTVGAGSYYLTNGCNFFNTGTTNIDSTLLASLSQKTTYPPLIYSNITVSTNVTLSPQAQRDIDAPDLGYHYDPIDYIVDNYAITNATLTLTNGVALAGYNDTGIELLDGSTIVSVGTPLYPNWLVRYQSVQEQPVSLGPNGPSGGFSALPYHLGSVGPSGTFRFTRFACPADGGYHFYNSSYSTNTFNNLLLQDCELWSGTNFLRPNTPIVITVINTLFARSGVFAAGAATTSYSLSLSNDLFWNVPITLRPFSNSNSWSVFNNDFDSCTITTSGQPSTNGYNAYLNCNSQLFPTNAHDVVTNTTLAYQAGPFGTFYQPTNSPLIYMGSTNANLIGLYHYTVTTNEVVEGTNIVSIGYHYVATDAYGNPLDSNGDGIPDYLEDGNGNGIYDTGDLGGWQNLNFNVIITRPRNGSILP